MFHFTIRDVLWFTTLSAVFVAWGIDRAKTRIDWQQVKATEQQLEAARKELHSAHAETKLAQHRQSLLARAAAQLGISLLDVAPETRIKPELLGRD